MCTITKGDTPISIWWSLKSELYGDERNLTTSDGVIITKTGQKVSMLTIEAVKARHRGNYSCFAHNKGGYSQHSAFLSVNGSIFLKNLFHN